MRHDWIFEVLEDLHRYALANGLPATAEQAERALRIAREEVAAQAGDGGPGDGKPENGLTH